MEQNNNEGAGSWLSGRASFNSVITFAATVLIAWVIFKLLGLLKFVAEMLREVFLFWNIALVEDIHNVLSSYTHVLMCRDRVDGTLRGTLLIGVERKGEYTLIKLGTTIFKNYYRGSPFIKLMTSYLTMVEHLKHPFTPLYVIAKVYSYKAYLHGVSMKEYYPVYNKETPEHFKKIFADFAEPIVCSKGGSAKYNPETFVIEQQDNYLAENLTILTEQDLQNPHIKFFVERNPGWKKGHCLVVGFQPSWMDYCTVVKHVITKVFGIQKKHPKTTKSSLQDESREYAPRRNGRSARPKLLKRYTFQDMSANAYAVNNVEYGVTGEAIVSPTSKAAFAFQTESEDLEVHSPGPTEFNVDLPSLT